MADTNIPDAPGPDSCVHYADGSSTTVADRVAMWFETFNAALRGSVERTNYLRMIDAQEQATEAHGFIPSIYRGPRP